MRERRLKSDWHSMKTLEHDSPFIQIINWNNPPEKYLVRFSCRSLIWLKESNQPSYSNRHELQIYLHRDYPRTPPQLIWTTNIFHPNILPPEQNGGVCIGSWSPSETLAQLCLRIAEMLQYKNYSIEDALNKKAADWAEKNIRSFPVDDRPLVVSEEKGRISNIDG